MQKKKLIIVSMDKVQVFSLTLRLQNCVSSNWTSNRVSKSKINQFELCTLTPTEGERETR